MKHIIVFIALSCLFLFSCTRNELHKSIDDQRNDPDSEELTIFMTTEQVFTSVEMKETFNSSKHSIFSSSALIRTTGNTYREFTVSGANHLEMKNHAGIKVCIEDEIDRFMSAQIVIGPVFPIL